MRCLNMLIMSWTGSGRLVGTTVTALAFSRHPLLSGILERQLNNLPAEVRAHVSAGESVGASS